MTKIRGAQILTGIAAILLTLNIADIDFQNFEESKGPILGSISNVLLILGMVMSIREMKKSED